MDLPLYQEAIGHFLSGVSIAFADRYFSNNSNNTSKTEERKRTKVEQVKALDFLLQAETNRTNSVHDREYCDAVIKAKDYFKTKGTSTSKKEEGIKGHLRTLANLFSISNERVNNLGIKRQLGVSFALEFIADAAVGVSQITLGYGNGIVALGESMYQAPSLLFGLQTGRALLYCRDMLRSKEEKELDSLGKQLTADGKVLELVRTYSVETILPKVKAKEDSPEEKGKGLQLTINVDPAELGAKAGKAVVSAVSGASKVASSAIEQIKNSMDARRKANETAEEQRRADLRKPYEKY